MVQPSASAMKELVFFDDFQDDLAVAARCGSVEKRADRLRRPALFADNPSQIFFGDFEFEDRGVVGLSLFDFYSVGIRDQGFCKILYQFLHAERIA
jgi:hypothetical protein